MSQWRDIPGWEGLYQVSSNGQVRSLDRCIYVRAPHGDFGHRRYIGQVLKLGMLKSGYKMAALTYPGRKRRYAYVHDLVLEAFIGPKPKGMECCHGNGVRSDNRIENLRYGTRSENAQDRKRNGAPWLKGEACGSSKLSEADVRWIRQNAGVYSFRAMARKLKVSHGTVTRAFRGESWGHVQ